MVVLAAYYDQIKLIRQVIRRGKIVRQNLEFRNLLAAEEC